MHVFSPLPGFLEPDSVRRALFAPCAQIDNSSLSAIVWMFQAEITARIGATLPQSLTVPCQRRSPLGEFVRTSISTVSGELGRLKPKQIKGRMLSAHIPNAQGKKRGTGGRAGCHLFCLTTIHSSVIQPTAKGGLRVALPAPE